MVICPGTLVKSIAMRNRGVPLRNYLAFTMSHELGHKIDSSKFGIYEAFKSCLLETKQFKLAQKKKLGEVTADYWAAETMARLRPGAAGDTPGLVKLALRELCRNKSNDLHPEGDTRVGFMGGNARIFSQAGCGELTGARKVCALEGTLVVGAGGTRPGGGRSSEDQVRGGAPLTRGTPNAAFLDEAEGILNSVSPEAAYRFLQKLSGGVAKEAFQNMYNARYQLDPSILREVIYDDQESPLIREIARREIERRMAGATTRALSRDYGMRPERALVLEHRLRRTLSRGEDAETARQLAGLMDTLTPAQIAQRLLRFQVEREALGRSKSDPTRLALVRREIWAAHEALGKEKGEGEEDDFRKLFARSWADIKRADLEFRRILDDAVEGDAGSKARLFRRLDGELALDFMGVHVSPGGDSALAVKLARVYARRATDGTLYLDLRARQHGFDEANGKPRQTLRLGKEDREIAAALEAFNQRASHGEARFRVGGRLQRFTVAGEAGETGRSFWRTDAKGGLVEYSPTAVDRSTAPRPTAPPLPTTVSPARAGALFKSYCAGCHGPGGRAPRFLDEKGKLFPRTVDLDRMLRSLRREDGSKFMPPLGTPESQSLSSDARDALIRWVEQEK
jgi:mono/diheme cytochrome c family protein